MKLTRHSAVNEARVIEVIEIKSISGKGIEGDPIREIREYFSKEGELLARTKSIEDLNLGVWSDDAPAQPDTERGDK